MKKQLDDPEIARTFDFSKVMKDYINNNKNYVMKLFKREPGKSEYENE